MNRILFFHLSMTESFYSISFENKNQIEICTQFVCVFFAIYTLSSSSSSIDDQNQNQKKVYRKKFRKKIADSIIISGSGTMNVCVCMENFPFFQTLIFRCFRKKNLNFFFLKEKKLRVIT